MRRRSTRLRERERRPAPPAVPAVALRGITKRFPGVVANDGVDFEAAAGEVHALLGENGAGKSTLSNILTGLYRPDEGEIALDGEPVDFHSPRDALDAGIGMVHQHFRLVEPFTVAENVVLGDHRDAGARSSLHPRAIEREVAELGERYGLAVDPRARIWQLSVGEQQRVEILKALYREARILILDEPTAVLTPQEADALFETLRAMADEGRTVIFISHKLHEVLAVADRVTVLRGGRRSATVATADATPRSLAALMVGREVETARAERRAHEPGRAGARARGRLGRRATAATPPCAASRSRCARGEIVGVAGRRGQRPARARRGDRRAARARRAGAVRVGGTRAARRRSARRDRAPASRTCPRTGSAPASRRASASRANTVLKSYREPPASRGPAAAPAARSARRAVTLIERYDVRGAGPDTPARQLSGGNLQKVVLGARVLRRRRACSSPRRRRAGSTSARSRPCTRTCARRPPSGVGVLLISEDLDEILALADRDRRHVRGRDRRRASTPRRRRSRSSAC